MGFCDTVAALSTPFGKGGIAVIRISGGDAFAVAERAFFPKNQKKLSECEVGRMIYGEIRLGEEPIDDGMAVLFRAPRSFTGEDTVEISCHGGIFVTQQVLTAVLSSGARAAEAGEFTRRAFVNGKMGLGGAEALGALLDAKNEDQLLLTIEVLESATATPNPANADARFLVPVSDVEDWEDLLKALVIDQMLLPQAF